jgi:hypothetical protein
VNFHAHLTQSIKEKVVSKKSLAALVLAAFIVGLASVATADISYTLSPVSLTDGYVVTGTITTDGTFGPITASNITSWSWSATDGILTYSETVPSSAGIAAGDLMATPTAIEMAIALQQAYPGFSTGGNFSEQGPDGHSLNYLANFAWQSPTVPSWQEAIELSLGPFAEFGPSFTPIMPAGPYIIATAVTTPEPSTSMLLGSELLLFSGIRLLRRRMPRQ